MLRITRLRKNFVALLKIRLTKKNTTTIQQQQQQQQKTLKLQLSRLLGLHRIHHPNYLMTSEIDLFFIGYKLKEAELEEVACVSGILNVSDAFLTAEARSEDQTYVPRVEDIKNDEWVDALRVPKTKN